MRSTGPTASRSTSTARAASGVRYSGASNRDGVIWLAVGGELRWANAGPASRPTRAGARMYLLREYMNGLLESPEIRDGANVPLFLQAASCMPSPSEQLIAQRRRGRGSGPDSQKKSGRSYLPS